MISASLAPHQIEIIERPPHQRIFLEGPAGSGKTTVGVGRLLYLLDSGIPANEILVIVPQRTLATPYQDALASERAPGGQVTILTMGGLARRMVDLFWPLIAEEAGFARPDSPPAFLTLETSLYYMAYLVRPLLEEGLFDSITIDRNRIYSQIIDNLNKSAVVGFPYTEIGERLKSAWLENTEQAHVYEDAQRCASLFREYCLQNNLLDFSLQMEVFASQLWRSFICRAYLKSCYRHIIIDNVEEDNPVASILLSEWLPEFESALVIYDTQAGYRRFLGADPDTAYGLLDVCDEHHIFTDTLVTSPALRALSDQLGRALERPDSGDTELDLRPPAPPRPLRSDELKIALEQPETPIRFYPAMLDWVVERVCQLIECGTPPGQIVLLAPLLPDSLRFSLTHRLESRQVPFRTHRPSRSLRDEPPAQALLTLAALAHPGWLVRPSTFEVAYALIQTVEGLDLVRAQLLVEAVYKNTAGQPVLLPFERVRPETQQRITYAIGNRYERLRQWLEVYQSDPATEVDFFLSRLFGEVLSQDGFVFHRNYNAGTISANLIESAQKFRWAVENRQPVVDPEQPEAPLGKEYLSMIQDGVLAAQYIQSWQIPPDDAVLIAPAYTFLLANQPVDHQFWLDVGSNAWFERLYQPLTHPYILSRSWTPDRIWTDADEYEHNRDTLYRLTLGLMRRCRRQIHLGLSDLSESGYESRGLLLKAIQVVLQQSRGYGQDAPQRGNP